MTQSTTTTSTTRRTIVAMAAPSGENSGSDEAGERRPERLGDRRGIAIETEHRVLLVDQDLDARRHGDPPDHLAPAAGRLDRREPAQHRPSDPSPPGPRRMKQGQA